MADVPELDPDKDTPESLEVKLQNYARAVRSEFETAVAGSSAEEDAEQFSLDFAKQNLSNNLAMIQWLAQNGSSDTVRMTASKYMVEVARESAKDDGDPLKKLFGKLAKNDPPVTSKAPLGNEDAGTDTDYEYEED